MKDWKTYTNILATAMDALAATGKDGEILSVETAFDRLAEETARIREAGRDVFLIGNGASASMASHFATDLLKNAHVRTEVFTDLALLTAVGNDISYEDVFAEPLRLKMRKGDMVVAISSSGKSPNVLAAAREAVSRDGFLVTLSAMSPDNPLRSMGALNFYIPGKTYGTSETAHSYILHYWIDRMCS